MANKPFGVDQDKRVEVPGGLKSEGVDAGGGIFNKYFNQALFETEADHIWGNQAQVTVDPATATFYTDGSGNPLDASASAVTINNDDKILIRHDTTQTAALLLDAGGKRFKLEMYGGVTLNMNTFNITLGGTGDEMAGSVKLIGTGTLTIEKANGFRVSHTAMTVATLAGDSVINNAVLADNLAIDWQATDLVMSIPTVATVDVDATKIQLVSGDNVIKIIEPLNVTLTMPTNLNAGSEKPSTDYETYISANVAGTVGKKLVPILTGTTDSTSSGFLADSTQTFLTDLVLQHSIVLNTTDGTSTTASLDAAAEGTFAVTDDIFTSGEDYTIYLVPTFDSGHIFYSKTGRVFNDSGNDFTKLEKFTHTLNQPRITTAFWHTNNGYGATNTKIQKFTTEDTASDDVVVTIKNIAGPAADDGFSITANMDCFLSITYTFQYSSSSIGGLSKNSSELTIIVQTITVTDRITQAQTSAVNQPNSVSISNERVSKGDIIRPHTSGTSAGARPADTMIHVTAIEIL